jgi:hypothetical protein
MKHLLFVISMILLYAGIDFGQLGVWVSDYGLIYQGEATWYVDLAPYRRLGQYPSNGLSAYMNPIQNEPEACYPMHSGNIKGISDTIGVLVTILNNDTVDYTIGTSQPQNWFMPVIYNVMTDPNTFAPIGDTTTIKYSFQRWNGLSSTPTILPKDRRGGYGLRYYIWNLPVGRTRLLMVKTANAPSGFQMQVEYTLPAWVAEPNSLADTLNAYGARYWRAFQNNAFTTAIGLCDSMIALNPPCAPAYQLKSYAYGLNASFDSLNCLTALDSTIAILERFGDPVLGDTIGWNETHWIWYKANLTEVKDTKSRLISGSIRELRL